MALEIGKSKLTLEDVFNVASKDQKVKLSSFAKIKIKKAHDYLLKRSKSGEVIYGVNTGFGILSNVKVEDQDLAQLQLNLLRSHAVGTGEPLSREKVRAMVLLRASTLVFVQPSVCIPRRSAHNMPSHPRSIFCLRLNRKNCSIGGFVGKSLHGKVSSNTFVQKPHTVHKEGDPSRCSG